MKRLRHSTRSLGTALSAVAVACVLTASLAGVAGNAAAAPASVASAQAKLDAALARREAAESRLAAAQARADAQAARLDKLAQRRAELQRKSDAYSVYLYRQGRFELIALLTQSRTFAEFERRWDMLARIARDNAKLAAQLEQANATAAASAEKLLAEQEAASKALRAVNAESARAQRDLASSKAAYAAYQARTTPAATPAKRAPSRPRAGKAPSSHAGWQKGVASHYGKGSIGRKTADGTRITADSMIVAHKTLPFGTLVEFSYNGRTAVGRVADRGPYVKGRDWDLGPGLVNVLGFNGVHTVHYRIVGRR